MLIRVSSAYLDSIYTEVFTFKGITIYSRKINIKEKMHKFLYVEKQLFELFIIAALFEEKEVGYIVIGPVRPSVVACS